MKISTKKIMLALRLYGIADQNDSVKLIRKLQTTDEKEFLRATFMFSNESYALLYGSTIIDDALDSYWPNIPEGVEALPSPHDHDQTITPFNGKYIMLFHKPIVAQRLDVYLANEFDSSVSRSLWQKYIMAGFVSINSQKCTSIKKMVSPVDSVSVQIPEPKHNSQDLPIIYEDEDLIVIDKPAGMLTHAKGGLATEPTVADFFKAHTSFGVETNRAGVVHRLDRDTSGVLIGARTDGAARHLQAQFAKRQAKKTYLAIVSGTPSPSEAVIDLPIGRNPQKPSTFRVDPRGKSAQTTYRVLATKGSHSLVELMPITGRTHQLRVHLAHIGTPILGDRVYGNQGGRLMLHASKIAIRLPSSNVEQSFSSPTPIDFIAEFSETLK